MTEADFQTRFGHWLQENGEAFSGDSSCAFELKFVTGTVTKIRGKDMVRWPCLSLQRVAPHQEAALARVEDMGLYFKLTDLSLGSKPFDCLWLAPRRRDRGSMAYLVVGYWMKGSGVVEALFVRISDWMALRRQMEAAEGKSVRREELEAIAERVEKV